MEISVNASCSVLLDKILSTDKCVQKMMSGFSFQSLKTVRVCACTIYTVFSFYKKIGVYDLILKTLYFSLCADSTLKKSCPDLFFNGKNSQIV